MKVYCGDYWKDAPKKRFPWLKACLVFVGLALTTAATPAMVAYYWNGQNSTETLAHTEALRLMQDDAAYEPSRLSAARKLFHLSKSSIQALKKAAVDGNNLASDSRIYLKKLAYFLEH